MTLALLVGAILGTDWLFRSGNPYFTIRNIRVTANGKLDRDDIIGILDNYGIERGEANLFAVDLEKLRAYLIDNFFLIDNAIVKRRLPDTLVVQVYERQPVAQFIRRRGRLIDSEGWLLPPRRDRVSRNLPIITGVRGSGEMEVGSRVDDEMVHAALRLLHLLAVEDYSAFFDVSTIQVDYAANALRMYLRPNGTFRRDSRVLVPTENMAQALRRVEVIVRKRLRARQTTSFIDATYEKNVPVLP